MKWNRSNTQTTKWLALLQLSALLMALMVLPARPAAADPSPVLHGGAAANEGRERLLMDSGWKFHLGKLGFEENIINAGVNGGRQD